LDFKFHQMYVFLVVAEHTYCKQSRTASIIDVDEQTDVQLSVNDTSNDVAEQNVKELQLQIRRLKWQVCCFLSQHTHARY